LLAKDQSYLYIKNWQFAIDRSWGWGVCLEEVKVKKLLSLWLLLDLKWIFFASFVIWLKKFDEKKWSREKDVDLLSPSSSKWHWHSHVKTHSHVYVSNQISQLLRGGIDQWSVGCNSSFFFTWVASKVTNPWVMQDQKNKFVRIRSTMTMSTHQWK
jgi:hypothetical protein